MAPVATERQGHAVVSTAHPVTLGVYQARAIRVFMEAGPEGITAMYPARRVARAVAIRAAAVRWLAADMQAADMQAADMEVAVTWVADMQAAVVWLVAVTQAVGIQAVGIQVAVTWVADMLVADMLVADTTGRAQAPSAVMPKFCSQKE